LQRRRQIVGAEPARRLCILIIDHDVDSAHRLGELLEQLGHDVDLAYDGSAGLDAARRLRPDAVFVGLTQPSGTGYRLARRLRRECNQDNVLLVAVASALSEEGCLRMREAGFDEQLLKSADREAVASLLSRRASRPVRS
jgi:DNA-binding response OmpR family regulator